MVLDAITSELENHDGIRGEGDGSTFLPVEYGDLDGERTMRSFLIGPCPERPAIEARLDAVDWFLGHTSSGGAPHNLGNFADIERIAGRIVYECRPRDLFTSRNA
jgi:DNA mismatch repair ATPase MutS